LPSPLEAPEVFDSSQYMVNVGLALKDRISIKEGEYFSVININSLPDSYRPKGVSMFNILAPVVALLLVGALVWGYFYIQGIQDDNKSLEDSVLQAEAQVPIAQLDLASLRTQVDELAAEIDPIYELAEKLDLLLINLRYDRELVSGDAQTAVYLAPDSDIDLTEIDATVGLTVISGLALTEFDVLDYASDLRLTGRWNIVVVSSIDRILPAEEGATQEDAYYQFELILA
jgi:type IV pilus assembly protein PilM